MRPRQLGGESEVRESHGAVRAQQYVLRLEIGVDPARAVEMGEPLTDLRDQSAAVGLGHPGVDELPQAGRSPLHDQHDRAVQGGPVRCAEHEGLQEPDQPRMPQPAPEFDLAAGGLHDPARLARCEGGGRHDLERDVGASLLRAATGRPRRVDRGPASGPDHLGDHPASHPVAGRQQVRAVALRRTAQAERRCHRPACRSRPRAPVRGGSSARCSSRTRPNRRASPTISSRLPLRRSALPCSRASGTPMRSFSSAR